LFIVIIVGISLSIGYLVGWNKLFPDTSNQYKIFELWTFVVAGIFSIFLLPIAWLLAKDFQDRSINYLVILFGMSLGWLIGIVLQPFTSAEAGQFNTYAASISAFLGGYGAGKLDDLIKYIFNPQNITQRRAFHGVLFSVSFLVALIAVYQARFGVNDLSITTILLPDGVAKKEYGPLPLRASGGISPLKWSIHPTLPVKLNLNPDTGVIDGTPDGPSPKTNYTITVTDSAKSLSASAKEFSLEIKQ
jgi:hypothetical protein